ncbi:MAG: VWA domain-containing protein, partial [Gemmatimonadales bacterium]
MRPWILLVLLAIPLWWWWRHRRMTPTVMTVSDATPFMAAARGRWRLLVPPALRGLALAAFIVAAAGPYRPGERASVRSDGIAIVIALDVSSSMLAEDFAPSNRLEVAKQQAKAFVNARPNDRIG